MPPKRRTSPKKLPPGLTWPQFRSEYAKNPYNGTVSEAWNKYKKETNIIEKKTSPPKAIAKKSPIRRVSPEKKKQEVKKKTSQQKEKIKQHQKKVLNDLRKVKSIQELTFNIGVSQGKEGRIKRTNFDNITVKDGEKIEEYVTNRLNESTKIRAIAIHGDIVSIFVKTPKKYVEDLRSSIIDQTEEEPIKGTNNKKFFLIELSAIEEASTENEEEDEETVEDIKLKKKSPKDEDETIEDIEMIEKAQRIKKGEKTPIKRKGGLKKASTKKKKSVTYKKGYSPPDMSPISLAGGDKELISSRKFNTTRTYKILEDGNDISDLHRSFRLIGEIRNRFLEETGLNFGEIVRFIGGKQLSASTKGKSIFRYQKGTAGTFVDIDDNYILQLNWQTKNPEKAIKELDLKVVDLEIDINDRKYTFIPIASSELVRDTEKAFSKTRDRRPSYFVAEILVKEKGKFVSLRSPLSDEQVGYLNNNVKELVRELPTDEVDYDVIPLKIQNIDGKLVQVHLQYNAAVSKNYAHKEVKGFLDKEEFTIRGKVYKISIH